MTYNNRTNARLVYGVRIDSGMVWAENLYGFEDEAGNISVPGTMPAIVKRAFKGCEPELSAYYCEMPCNNDILSHITANNTRIFNRLARKLRSSS